MKISKLILGLVFALVASTSYAQDFSDPQYAKWGDTPEVRRENILASTFLREELQNRNYNNAAHYLQQLLKNCPAAAESTYANGINLYKQKINRARSLAEKNSYVDSLLYLYDMRLTHFGSHPTRGEAYILDRKAREHLIYRSSDREGIRKDFEAAIKAQVSATGSASPELVAIYFKNICDDYSNDIVDAMTVVNIYDECSKHFVSIDPSQAEYKAQFENCFGMSGAASCENLQHIFEDKIKANPDDINLLEQAFLLMSRAGCESDYYLSIGEKFYSLKPQANVAIELARVFQNKKEFAKASQYLRETLAKETDPNEQEKLLTRIGILEMSTKNYSAAIEAFNKSINIDPEDDDGLALYFLAQCFAIGSSSCSGLSRQATYWVAYDVMQRAIPLLEVTDANVAASARQLAGSYRACFPSQEECFFAELSAGASFTLGCGFAKGRTTRVRYR